MAVVTDAVIPPAMAATAAVVAATATTATHPVTRMMGQATRSRILLRLKLIMLLVQTSNLTGRVKSPEILKYLLVLNIYLRMIWEVQRRTSS